MKKFGVILVTAALAGAASAQFTQGNLVVSVLSQPTTGSAAISLREFTTAGAAVGADLSLSGIGGRNLTTAYGETSEGQLRLSGDKRFLMIGGYDFAANTSGWTATGTSRVVGRIDFNRNVALSNAFTPASGDGARGVWSDDGNNFFVTGGDQGIITGTMTGGSVTQFQPSSNASLSSRSIQRVGSTLFFTGSNAFNLSNGMASWDGASADIAPVAPAPNGGSSRDFFFADPNTLYISTSSSGVGLVKLSLVNGTFTPSYSTQTGRGISAFTVSGNTVYALNSNGSELLRAIDNGTSFSNWEVLSTAAAGTRYRGIDFSPVPEPMTMTVLGLGALIAARRRRNKKS